MTLIPVHGLSDQDLDREVEKCKEQLKLWNFKLSHVLHEQQKRQDHKRYVEQADAIQRRLDDQRDYDSFIEENSLGGRTYRE